MNERRWLQGVARAFFPQVASGQLTQFLIDKWCEVMEGVLVTLRPIGKQPRHFVGGRHGSCVESTDLQSWRDYTPSRPPLRTAPEYAHKRNVLAMIDFRSQFRMSK